MVAHGGFFPSGQRARGAWHLPSTCGLPSGHTTRTGGHLGSLSFAGVPSGHIAGAEGHGPSSGAGLPSGHVLQGGLVPSGHSVTGGVTGGVTGPQFGLFLVGSSGHAQGGFDPSSQSQHPHLPFESIVPAIHCFKTSVTQVGGGAVVEGVAPTF